MLIALFISILGGGQVASTIFEIPRFDVMIKESVEDVNRRRTLLHVYYEAQASLDAHKTYQKKHRSVALSANRNEMISRDTLNMLFESGAHARKHHQETMIQHGVRFREHITEQEWESIFDQVFKTPDKAKKQAKQKKKAKKHKNKAMAKLNQRLTNLAEIKLSRDDAEAETIGDLKEFQALKESIVMLKEQSQEMAASRKAFWKTKAFPVDEVQEYYKEINTLQATVMSAFLDARFAIEENVTPAHWLSVSKDLANLFE